MTAALYTTQDRPAEDRRRYWHDVVATAYFPLDLTFGSLDVFSGRLESWDLGVAGLSRLTCEPAAYRRTARHLAQERAEQYLVTLPLASPVGFRQRGAETACGPGGMLIEQGHEPYEFRHAAPNDLWVLKLPGDLMAARLRQPERFCSLAFDAGTGVAGLFADVVRLLPGRLAGMDADARSAVVAHLVDLLALSVRGDARVLSSTRSSVRAGHLTRAEAHIRRELRDPALSAAQIAGACGISLRYLHDLFRDSGTSVSRFVQEQRLLACREALDRPADAQTIAAIAYRWGFNDQAQFSRLFRARFGLSPRDYRQAALRARLDPA